jgi:hypothetical protein
MVKVRNTEEISREQGQHNRYKDEGTTTERHK